MGEHGHGPKGLPCEIPDPSIYKVEDVPCLKDVQDRLAKRGLKDPWLRNEVWRYHPDFGTTRERIMAVVFRGWKTGLAACAVCVLIEYGLNKTKTPDEGHASH